MAVLLVFDSERAEDLRFHNEIRSSRSALRQGRHAVGEIVSKFGIHGTHWESGSAAVRV